MRQEVKASRSSTGVGGASEYAFFGEQRLLFSGLKGWESVLGAMTPRVEFLNHLKELKAAPQTVFYDSAVRFRLTCN